MYKLTLAVSLALLGFCLLTTGCGEDVTGPGSSMESSQEPGSDAEAVLGTSAFPISTKPDLVVDDLTENCFVIGVRVRNVSTRGAHFGQISVSVTSPQGFYGTATWGSKYSVLWPGQSFVVYVADRSCTLCPLNTSCCAPGGRHDLTGKVLFPRKDAESNIFNNSRTERHYMGRC